MKNMKKLKKSKNEEKKKKENGETVEEIEQDQDEEGLKILLRFQSRVWRRSPFLTEEPRRQFLGS